MDAYQLVYDYSRLAEPSKLKFSKQILKADIEVVGFHEQSFLDRGIQRASEQA